MMRGMEPWVISPIATVQSPFQEKFGIPRQSGLTELAVQLHLRPERAQPSALSGIADGSHLWLIFGFHAIREPETAATVRPPRLGGNQRRGVYATRSPFRPNRLGLSLVKLVDIDGLILTVSGADLLDQTPIFDIKPFVPYCDSPAQAHHWAQDPPQAIPVDCEPELAQRIAASGDLTRLWSEIRDYLRWDPRPSYRKIPDPHHYRQRYGEYEIQFRRETSGVIVENIEPANTVRRKPS